MRIFSNKKRPFHLSPYPLEQVKRAPVAEATLREARDWQPAEAASGNLLAEACREYSKIYEEFRNGDVAAEKAPYWADPALRAKEIKSLGLFFDATLVGACAIPALAWKEQAAPNHTHALVLLVEYNDSVERSNPVYELIRTSEGAAAKMRASEIAVIVSLYIRQLGFAATAHTPHVNDISLPMLAVNAGLARYEQGRRSAPFLGTRFAIAVVTTDMELAADMPLAQKSFAEGGAAWWFGVGGTETAWNRAARQRRPGEWGRYPMEKVKRVEETTTLIIHEEVPRLPKRAGGFARAKMGDYGSKAATEIVRFASKTPVGTALRALQLAQVAHQKGPVAAQVMPESTNPELNRRALKTLLHHLGADISGTCEAKPYVWYSHDYEGKPLDIPHKSAMVIVIDQGFETMEGASGDDWVSGTQSYRAYLRGAQICGVVAAYIRSLGHEAESHSNASSKVIQTPLVVLSGLGEMSRIGETVLNPFIGPRSKSAVLTTNIPVAWDKPIDFGLQDACSKCWKCARECPCNAITFGGTVMINGYETWKQDVQRCTSYRVTNQGGAACGRCMKTCPFNNEGLLVHRILLWATIHIPAFRNYIERLDDWVGNGKINPIKKWWSELEVVAGKIVVPKNINRRDLDIAKEALYKGTDRQKIAYNAAVTLPPPNWMAPFPTNRQAEVDLAKEFETPAQARERVKLHGPRPQHYVPVPPAAEPPTPTVTSAAPSPMHKG